MELANILEKQQQSKLISALYVTATPIGNMGDITLRALDVLEKATYIICENISVTKKLLSFYGLGAKKLLTYNDHSDEKTRHSIENLIANGNSVALVSDAGTPLISDPGHKLVTYLMEKNIKIISIPGSSALTSSLAISGQATDRFLFAGFLPNIKTKKKNELLELKNIEASLVFYESPNRLLDTLKIMLEVFQDRNASVVREITKIYEEVKKDSLTNLIAHFEKNKVKGEIVIIVSGAKKSAAISEEEITRQIKTALKNMSLKDAVKFVAENSGVKKNVIYKKALSYIDK